MNYKKRMLAMLLLVSLLAGYAGGKETKGEAVTISKETEWNIRCLNAEKSYEESKHLPKIRVAVLDSGLDTDRNIPFVKRKDFLGESELHSLYQDKTGHGTSVAGLICARENDDRITGIAANVELYVGRILDADNQAPVDRVVEAVEWAISEKVNIIHMSFGTRWDSEELETVIKKAYDQGILLIAAAGNAGNAAEDESTIEYPAAYDEVISVGATDSDNAVLGSSSTGEELDVVAPGNQILSTGAFGGVVVDDGTSVSAAQVTAIAAVLWGRYPDKSNEFIKGLLVGSANEEAVHGDCGRGLVDYRQTVENYPRMNAAYQRYKIKGFTEKRAVSRAEEGLPENERSIPSYRREVNYVNGLWLADKHEQLVDEGKGLGAEEILIVKAGATLPDALESMHKMSLHPCFHGAGNYFANVNYLLAYSRQLVKEGKEGLPEFKTFFKKGKDYDKLTEDAKKDIQTQLSACQDEFFANCANRVQNGVELSVPQKGYAVLGLALHTITDTYAHKGYRKDTERTKQFFQFIHNRPEDEVIQLWSSIADKKNKKSSASDKKYYGYMKENYACADDAEKMKIRSVLSQHTAKELIAALNGTDDFLDKMKTILVGYQNETTGDTEPIDQAVNFRLENVNGLWAAVKGDGTKFAIHVDAKTNTPALPADSKIKVKVKSKKVTVTFPHKDNYNYQVYYVKETNKVFFTRNKKKYTVKTKGMEGNTIYIAAFYNSHVSTKQFQICYNVKYFYKKKQKIQTEKFNPKKLSFELRRNIFKLKKKKFKGWSKKKNAKKATYKAGKKMKFSGNGELKLYCVTK